MEFKNAINNEIVNYLNNITTKNKDLVYNSTELKNPPSLGFFTINPYKGWMLNGENIFGYKKYRVVFDQDCVVIIQKSYPEINERLYYRECDDQIELKSFFNTIKSYVNNDNELINLTNTIESDIISIVENVKSEFLAKTIQASKEEEERIMKLKSSRDSEILSLDKNSDGLIDLIENDFNKLLTKNQKHVLEIDKNYIHQFVKISNFIKTKKQNTQKIFESIRDTSSHEELEERVNLLKNQIHSYELLVFHSINMIGSLISEDLITFYEIYESFDKLGMFNSNWENEVSERLTNIGDKLDDLMYSIYSMERNIVSGLSQLTYVTQEGFSDLERSVTRELQSIDSSIKFNNLLTGISTYQLYKINKQTKPLLPK
jgi:hypothetical protein